MAERRLPALMLLLAGATAFLAWHVTTRGPGPPYTAAGPVAAAPDASVEAARASDTAARERLGAQQRAPSVRIHAVLADTGAPAVGAEVWYLPRCSESDRDAFDEAVRQTNDLEGVLRRLGARARSDVSGRVDVDAEPGSRLCARLDAQYGESILERGWPVETSPYRVELAADARLRIQVVDSSGRPAADLPVEVLGRHVDPWTGGIGTFRAELGVTDAAGVVEHHHVQCLIPRRDRRSADWQLRARIALEHLSAVERTIGEGDFDADIHVRLVVPMGGRVTLEFVDDRGRPLPVDDWTLEAAFAHSAEQAGPRAHEVDLVPPDAPALVRVPATAEPHRIIGTLAPSERAVEFQQVPLHARWQFVVRTPGIDCRHEFAGPTHPGEAMHVRVVTDLVRCDVHGRIRLASGEAVVGAYVWLRADAAVDREHAVSNATGRFVTSAAVHRGRLPLANACLDVRPTDDTTKVEVPLPRIDASSTDAGTIEVPALSTVPLLATVRLTNGGRPIVDHSLLVTVDASSCGVGIRDLRVTKTGDAWLLRSSTAEPRLRLTMDFFGTGSRISVPFQRGAVLDLVVPPPATNLAISVVPPAVPWGLVWAEVVAAGADAKGAVVAYPEASHGALAFHWHFLEDGAHTLRIGVQNTLLHEVRGVELREGANEWPRDGSSFDLRARGGARVIAVSAQTAAGEPLGTSMVAGESSALLRAVPPTGDVTAMLRCSNSFSGGRSTVILESPPADLVVTARGHVPVRLAAPASDVALRLRSNSEVVLHPPEGEGIQLHVRLVDDGLRDPLVRAADAATGDAASLCQDEALEWKPTDDEPSLRLHLHPDAVLEVAVVRKGGVGPTERVLVPPVGLREVRLR